MLAFYPPIRGKAWKNATRAQSVDAAYAELKPPAPLDRFVRLVWSLELDGGTPGEPQPIIPDGCPELVLNFADPFVRRWGNARERQSRMLVAGQITRSVLVEPQGRIFLVGVRLHPWAFRPLLEVPALELRDHILPMSDVAPRRLHDGLAVVAPSTTAQATARQVMSALTAYVAAVDVPNQLARRAVRSLLTAGQPLSVRQLASACGRSARQIQRAFRDELGLSPRTFIRIRRMQWAMGIALSQPHLTWATIAARCEFHDQAHLIRDFRQFVGCAPGEVRADPGTVTHHMVNREWLP